MSRPNNDLPASQHKKYEFHKKANGTLNYYLEQGNHIGAYVIAYSLLEDRLRAMYVVVQRDVNKTQPDLKDIKGSLAGIISRLTRDGYLPIELKGKLLRANMERNTLLHDAMWQIDIFKQDNVLVVKKLKNEVAKILENIKKTVKPKVA